MRPYHEEGAESGKAEKHQERGRMEMMRAAKRTALVTCAALIALTLCSCGSNGNSSNGSGNAQTEEGILEVESIDYSTDRGNIKYGYVEKASEGLTDSKNALVFVFDFTNKQDKPTSASSTFIIEFFQNGAELSDHPSYSSSGGDQFKLVSASSDSAMKDGTVQFGQIVIPKDNSPITILVKPNGYFSDSEYQTMEVDISDLDGMATGAMNASAEQVDAALQGSWSVEGSGTFTFDQGALTVDASGTVMKGTYEVDEGSSTIVGHLGTTDGSVKVSLPYEYGKESGLKVFNNRNVEMVKL